MSRDVPTHRFASPARTPRSSRSAIAGCMPAKHGTVSLWLADSRENCTRVTERSALDARVLHRQSGSPGGIHVAKKAAPVVDHLTELHQPAHEVEAEKLRHWMVGVQRHDKIKHLSRAHTPSKTIKVDYSRQRCYVHLCASMRISAPLATVRCERGAYTLPGID